MIAERWPIHPKPITGEALSSWLQRIASCYDLTVENLLEYELGNSDLLPGNLDKDPPLLLLELISRRTGHTIDTVKSMTAAGLVPFLFDSLSPHERYFENYVCQRSVLLPPSLRYSRSLPEWIPWFLQKTEAKIGCRMCLANYPDAPILLHWQFALMASCPKHGLLLEPLALVPGLTLRWEAKKPKKAPHSMRVLDNRTWQALNTGFVDLPQRRVHAGVWFRLLRTILDELNTPMKNLSRYRGLVIQIWEGTGRPPRAGEVAWKPFESLPSKKRTAMLLAAAEAIEQIEKGSLSPSGADGPLFRPPPDTHIEHKNARNPEPISYASKWQEAMRYLEEVIALAKNDPKEAQQFRHMLLFGKRDEESIRKVDKLLLDVGIETTTLPYPKAGIY